MLSSCEANLDNETRVARILADRYPQGEAALARMTELLRGARRTRMPSLLVVGEPDVGKTTILKKFMRGHAPIFDPETGQTTSEVVAIEAPPEADEARLYAAILQAISAPAGGGRLIDLERIVHLQLARLGARLPIIDETNNLVIGTGSAQRKTLAALRRLSNQLHLSLACFGTVEALHALTSDPQVEGRVQPFQLTRLGNAADYATIVRSVIAFYPLRRTSTVDQPFVDSVHELTAGSPGKTFRLLNAPPCTPSTPARSKSRRRPCASTTSHDRFARPLRCGAGCGRGAEMRPLPFAPRPLAGEGLSSWVARLAVHNLVTPGELWAATTSSTSC